ncbi:hypothetical protein ABW19_dt0209774 [Dactylella cylindrospora]|nr:hypothetical protein ABW19_dt0209774 [Dactylella cylindrospora]
MLRRRPESSANRPLLIIIHYSGHSSRLTRILRLLPKRTVAPLDQCDSALDLRSKIRLLAPIILSSRQWSYNRLSILRRRGQRHCLRANRFIPQHQSTFKHRSGNSGEHLLPEGIVTAQGSQNLLDVLDRPQVSQATDHPRRVVVFRFRDLGDGVQVLRAGH